jgi:SAM-dependent methyltransferase
MSQNKNPIQQVRLYITQLFWANRYTERYAQDHCSWFARMEKTLLPFMPSFANIRALDVGSGMLQWQTIMLHSRGAKVTGVDMEYTRADRRIDKYWHILRSNGLERMLKTAYWDYVYRPRYLSALQKCSPFKLNTENLDLRQHLAERIPFEDESFDLVVSHEVFEHIEDIHAASTEIKRVLKPNGLAYIVVHLFPSISGGHHMAWKFPDTEPSETVPPWDHLRQKLYPEHPSWLNELRESNYRQVFESLFEILLWEASAYEGKNLLTAEIKAELKDYSEEELLKKGLVIVVRKPRA